MLLDRIESPVPDWTETPARTLKAIVLPAPDTVPPIVLADALVLTITPFTSLPSGALPVMSVPIRLPSTRLSVAEGPSSRTPQLLAEIRFKAAAVVPPMVLPVAPRIATPSWALGIAYSPVLSVPIRLPSTRFRVDVAPEMTTPWLLPEMTCEPW